MNSFPLLVAEKDTLSQSLEHFLERFSFPLKAHAILAGKKLTNRKFNSFFLNLKKGPKKHLSTDLGCRVF